MRRILALAVAAMFCTGAIAQLYPAKPVKVLVPFSPGGTSDIVARLVAAKLSEELGQQFVVENRGGAGGTIATAVVAKAPPDGYLILAAHQGVAFNATLYTKLSYDTAKELLPLAMIGPTPNVLVTTNAFAPKTVQEFLAYARGNPGVVTYGSGGVGSAAHLSVELLESLAQIRLAHIPYKGAGPALNDLVAGRADYAIIGLYPGLDEAAKHGLADKVEALEPPLLTAEMFLAFSKKSACRDLAGKVATALAAMRTDGRLDALVRESTTKWQKR